MQRDFIWHKMTEENIIHLAQQIDKNNAENLLRNEIVLLKAQLEKEDFENCLTIDQFYQSIDKRNKFPNLVDLFKNVSTCSISNAECESMLSKSALIIDKKSTWYY